MSERSEGPKLGPYSMHEVISSFRKEIKLGDVDAAMYWTNVILKFAGSSGPKIVLKQLWIMAAEDIDSTEMVLRTAAVAQMQTLVPVPETDHLFFLVGAFCRARKWWETEEGRAVDEAWAKAEGDLKTKPREIPGYALDRHTRRGWELKNQGIPFDDRFSGTEIGRQKTVYLFLKYGEIRKDLAVDEEFWQFWNRRKKMQGLDVPDPVWSVGDGDSSDDGKNVQQTLT